MMRTALLALTLATSMPPFPHIRCSSRWSCGVVMFAGLLGACAGTGEGLDRFGRVLEPGDTGVGPWELVQVGVFSSRCTKCHQGADSPMGLDLSGADAWTRLVDVPSKELPSMPLIVAKSPESSYLWAKVAAESDLRLGSRMPRDGPPYLDSAELATLEDWIRDGITDDDALLPNGGTE